MELVDLHLMAAFVCIFGQTSLNAKDGKKPNVFHAILCLRSQRNVKFFEKNANFS
jgi:hypothetical protein